MAVAPLLTPLYDLYCFRVLPLLGQIVAGDRDAYHLSGREHPPLSAAGRAAARMIAAAGFEQVALSQPDRRHRRAAFGLAALSAIAARVRASMPRACSPSRRALSSAIGVILARHDALFLLEHVAGARPLLRLAAAVAPARRARGCGPGERLAAALAGDRARASSSSASCCRPRADLLGEEVAADLARLQDRLPPFPGDEARAADRARVRQAARQRCSPRSTTSRSPPPRSRRCISRATSEGEEVAVKVLRPGIAARLRPRSRPVDLARATGRTRCSRRCAG